MRAFTHQKFQIAIKKRFAAGFTLIELLVVIAIVALLSSVVLAALNSSREKASDTKVVAEMKGIESALLMYYNKHGSMPPNRLDGYAYSSTNADFLSELVDEKFLPSKPTPPEGYRYQYYNYGPRNDRGAMVVTTLLEDPATLTGRAGSCRPFTNTNWCRKDVTSRYHCICVKY